MTPHPNGSRPAPGGAELFRNRVLTILGAAGSALTTTEIRQRINSRLTDPVHHEFVYRNLRVLENRRRIRREQLAGRDVAWHLMPPRPPLSAHVPRRHPVVAGRDAAATETTRRGGTASLTADSTRQARTR